MNAESVRDLRPDPGGAPVSFAAVDIRAALASHPYRPPNYEAEDRALTALALAGNPRNVLQKLVETALDLCQAGTAGISLLETHDGVDLFRWEALAGVFAASRNNTMPRNAGPSGVCIDENATQLMYLRSDPHFVETLLVPVHCEGRPIGAL
jgi:hypothetical protein